MKLRTFRIVLLLVLTEPLLTAGVPPASATVVKNVAFTGTATLSNGLGYPCTPLGTTDCVDDLTGIGTKNDPKNVLQPTYWGGGHYAIFQFASVSCLDQGVALMKPDKGSTTAGFCVLRTRGIVTGYCGLSTATGTVEYVASNGSLYVLRYKWTGVGGKLYITGGSKQTNIRGVADAVPVPGLGPNDPSCLSGTQTSFAVFGDFTYKDCTSPSPCPPL